MSAPFDIASGILLAAGPILMIAAGVGSLLAAERGDSEALKIPLALLALGLFFCFAILRRSFGW